MKNFTVCFLLIITSVTITYSQPAWVFQKTPTTANQVIIQFVNSNYGFASSLRTTNGGINWYMLSGWFRSLSFPVINTGYAGSDNYVYKTTDGGLSWFSLGGIKKYYVQFPTADTGFAGGGFQLAVHTFYDIVFYKTSNGGVIWDSTVFQPLTGDAIDNRVTSIYTLNSKTCYFAQYTFDWSEHEGMAIWKTTNFGVNWSSFGSNDTVTYYSLKFPAADTGYCIGHQSTIRGIGPFHHYIYKIVNNNLQIKFSIIQGMDDAGLHNLYFVNVNTGYAVGDWGIILKTTNAGENWTTLYSGTGASLWDINFVNNNTGYISGNAGLIMKTTTGGVTPTYTVSGIVKYQDNGLPVSSGKIKALKYDSYTQQILTLDSAIIQSNGSYLLAKVPSDSTDIMAFQDDEDAAAFVPTYYISTIYWQNSTTLFPTSNLTNIDINVYRKVSEGDNKFTSGKVFNGTSDILITGLKDAIIYSKVGNLFKGYSKSNSLGNYKIDSLAAGAHEIIVDRIGFNSQSKMVNVVSPGLDTVNFTMNLYLTPIIKISEITPENFSLFQNYPNPFNPSSIIKYQIAKFGFVTLKIYDVLGKEVVTLANENQQPGIYEVDFDGRNCPSGIYFYKLTAGEFSETRKMVLLK